jgi:hypothetical protein
MKIELIERLARLSMFGEMASYICVTSARGLIEMVGPNTDATKMMIQLSKRERATILAALRRWRSYPAARGADSIATNGGKHKALDDAEIDRLCERITELKTKRCAAHLLPQSSNGARLDSGARVDQERQLPHSLIRP